MPKRQFGGKALRQLTFKSSLTIGCSIICPTGKPPFGYSSQIGTVGGSVCVLAALTSPPPPPASFFFLFFFFLAAVCSPPSAVDGSLSPFSTASAETSPFCSPFVAAVSLSPPSTMFSPPPPPSFFFFLFFFFFLACVSSVKVCII